MSARSMRKEVTRTVTEVLAPILEADGGGLELVSVDEDKKEIVLRFTGAFAACPGTPAVREDVIEPLLRAAAGGRATFRYER